LYPLVDIDADRLLQFQLTHQLSGGTEPNLFSEGSMLVPTLIQVLKGQESSFLTSSWSFPVTGTPCCGLRSTYSAGVFFIAAGYGLRRKRLPVKTIAIPPSKTNHTKKKKCLEQINEEAEGRMSSVVAGSWDLSEARCLIA
jgi:hypothetical protein